MLSVGRVFPFSISLIVHSESPARLASFNRDKPAMTRFTRSRSPSGSVMASLREA